LTADDNPDAVIGMAIELKPDIVHLTGFNLCATPEFVTKIKEACPGIRVMQAIAVYGPEAIKEAKAVEDIEHTIDEDYLKTKGLFVKYGATMNKGAIIIFDDLVEFLENAADMCADTADYIYVLSSRE
jgi:uncharacterized protein Yka (UPF0111/DUF47 family)